MTVAFEVAVVAVALEEAEEDDVSGLTWPCSLLKGNEITGNPVSVLDEGRLVAFPSLATSAGATVGRGAVGVGVVIGVGTGRARVVDGVDVDVDAVLLLLLLLLIVALPEVEVGRPFEIREGDC